MTRTTRRRKTWREKLNNQSLPKLVDIPPKMVKKFGKGRMLVPSPRDVDALIRKVKRGKLVTQPQIREKLARDFHADVTCPITTGIFVWIASEAAEEELRAGKKRVTPCWRVIRDNGGLNEKFPGGVREQARRLRLEGHRITTVKTGSTPRVEDFEARLARL